jgi:hypothetical protein
VAPITVHVVEGHSVLIAAGAALVGAAIGVGGSWALQRGRIKNEQKQLKRQLKAEKARLMARLIHDRDMQERESLRKIIDIALDAARVQTITMGQAIRHSRFGEELPASGVGLAGSKLLIRLGRRHAITEKFAELRDALFAVKDLIEEDVNVLMQDDRREECEKAHVRAMTAMAAFGDTAARLVGTPLTATRTSVEP